MNILGLKNRIVAQRHQLVIIDRQGRLVSSCDSIIPLRHLIGSDILQSFHLFEGLESHILELQVGDEGLHLPMMGFLFEDKPYRLSLEFWVDAEVDGILWLLSTEDIPSEKLRQIQQDRNETYIGLERITEQEQTLREYTLRLESAHQTLQRFAYIVSHDLKAPLRAIGNLAIWIDEAVQNKAWEELPEYLHLLAARVTRMEDLIEGILQYHRAGLDPREFEMVDLHALLIELHETIFNTHSCHLRIASDLPQLFCSRTAIYQIFSNLFSNVRKYAHTRECEVNVGYEDLGNAHKFLVTDRGPGIDPRHHESIFEIFQTLQSKDDNESTGIGLSIVQRIVTEAGGKVGLDSELGKGATFWFTWPKSEPVHA